MHADADYSCTLVKEWTQAATIALDIFSFNRIDNIQDVNANENALKFWHN